MAEDRLPPGVVGALSLPTALRIMGQLRRADPDFGVANRYTLLTWIVGQGG